MAGRAETTARIRRPARSLHSRYAITSNSGALTLPTDLPRYEPTPGELLPGDFWHATPGDPTNFLFHNVWAGNGYLPSTSATRRQRAAILTLGDLIPRTGAREEVWEEVRAASFPAKPQRAGAFFLFERREDADRCAREWAADSEYAVVRARILRSARVHRGDMAWFGEPAANWRVAAGEYWRQAGHPENAAVWEWIIDGLVYFPDWRVTPFGPFVGKHGGIGGRDEA